MWVVGVIIDQDYKNSNDSTSKLFNRFVSYVAVGFMILINNKYNRMKYRISLKNHLFALQGAIIFTIVVFVGVFFIGINKGFELNLYTYFSIFYLINIGVVFLVHFQYYQVNKHTSICIMPEKQILYKSNKSEKKINFNEIVNVEIHMVPSLYHGNRIQILPFEQYHYAVLNTVNEKIVISSLVIKNPIEVFTDLGIKIIRVKRFFPNIDL